MSAPAKSVCESRFPSGAGRHVARGYRHRLCPARSSWAPFSLAASGCKKYVGSNFVFRGGRYDNIRIVVVESGTGFARARRATQALIDAHSPKWILSCGFAGALVPTVKIGDIVVADSIVDTHGQIADDRRRPSPPIRSAACTSAGCSTSDAIVRLVSEKQQLAAQHSVRLPSTWKAWPSRRSAASRGSAACRSARSATTWRAILPPEVLSLIGPTGTTRFGAALAAVLSTARERQRHVEASAIGPFRRRTPRDVSRRHRDPALQFAALRLGGFWNRVALAAGPPVS